MVETPDDAAAFIQEAGFCLWRAGQVPFPLTTLEEATPWIGHDLVYNTWFWKDDLHIDKRVFYGQLIGSAGVACFVAWDFVPYLIAAVGDNDPRTLYENNRLGHVALTLFEHVERHGPTAKNQLPYPARTSRTPPLIQLQQNFLFVKHGLTGRTRGTYGYIWGLGETWMPDAFAQASRITVGDARREVVARLQAQASTLTPADVARLLRWREEP